MLNEFIFFASLLVDFGFVLLARRLGKPWLFTMIVLNLLLIGTFGAKLMTVFGFETNVGNVFYAAVFLASHMLTEHYGRREGYNAAWVGFGSLVFYTVMGQFVLLITPVPASATIDAAMHVLFQAVPRITFASLTAYLIVQYLNVWMFDSLRRGRGMKGLWVRDNASNLCGQLLDSLIFFTLAFYGTIPDAVLIQTIIVGFIVKSFAGMIGTGFMYLSYAVGSDQQKGFLMAFRSAP